MAEMYATHYAVQVTGACCSCLNMARNWLVLRHEFKARLLCSVRLFQKLHFTLLANGLNAEL